MLLPLLQFSAKSCHGAFQLQIMAWLMVQNLQQAGQQVQLVPWVADDGCI
jgi:hypothetical protein